MDVATLQTWINAHIPSIWGPIVGILVVGVYEIVLVKFPSLGNVLPSLVALLPASSTSTSATSATASSASGLVSSTNHPVIAALLNALDPTRVISILTTEIQSMYSPPEPAIPVTSPAAAAAGS